MKYIVCVWWITVSLKVRQRDPGTWMQPPTEQPNKPAPEVGVPAPGRASKAQNTINANNQSISQSTDELVNIQSISQPFSRDTTLVKPFRQPMYCKQNVRQTWRQKQQLKQNDFSRLRLLTTWLRKKNFSDKRTLKKFTWNVRIVTQIVFKKLEAYKQVMH